MHNRSMPARYHKRLNQTSSYQNPLTQCDPLIAPCRPWNLRPLPLPLLQQQLVWPTAEWTHTPRYRRGGKRIAAASTLAQPVPDHHPLQHAPYINQNMAAVYRTARLEHSKTNNIVALFRTTNCTCTNTPSQSEIDRECVYQHSGRTSHSIAAPTFLGLSHQLNVSHPVRSFSQAASLLDGSDHRVGHR